MSAGHGRGRFAGQSTCALPVPLQCEAMSGDDNAAIVDDDDKPQFVALAGTNLGRAIRGRREAFPLPLPCRAFWVAIVGNDAVELAL